MMGSSTCLPPGFGEHYDLVGKQAQAEFCEARCLGTAECNFPGMATGRHQGLPMVQDCGDLTAEAGISGELKGNVREKSCHVANPEICWATPLRQIALTTQTVRVFASSVCTGSAMRSSC